MKLSQRRATILLCSVALALLAGPAIAKRVHKAHRHASQVTMQTPNYGDARSMNVVKPQAASVSGAAIAMPRRARTPPSKASPATGWRGLARGRIAFQFRLRRLHH